MVDPRDFMERRNESAKRRIGPFKRILMDMIQQESDKRWIDKWGGRTMTTEECKAATGYWPEGNY